PQSRNFRAGRRKSWAGPSAVRLPGLDRTRPGASPPLAGTRCPSIDQHASGRHRYGPGNRAFRLRSSHPPGSWHAHPRQPPHDNDRPHGALPLEPQSHLSRLLACSIRSLPLGQQSRLADYAHSSCCAHVARGHPEGRALPRSTVSLEVLTLQGFGPSVALAVRRLPHVARFVRRGKTRTFALTPILRRRRRSFL